jgi:hypothetical protein
MTDLLQILLEMRSGQVAADCNAKFNSVLKAVLETGGKGKLGIELTIAPSRMGMGGAVIEVELHHDIKVKAPELQIGKSVFFVGPDGELSREDPAQTAMFQKQVEQEERRQ